MNTSTSMGPVQFAGMTYLICSVVSLGVAGIIQLLFRIIKLQKSRVAVKAAALQPPKNTNSSCS
jgi:hypothetical protein